VPPRARNRTGPQLTLSSPAEAAPRITTDVNGRCPTARVIEAQTLTHLTRHKISCREPSAHATQHTLTAAGTPSVNVRLARGQLHRLVRPSLGSTVLPIATVRKELPAAAAGRLDAADVRAVDRQVSIQQIVFPEEVGRSQLIAET
jgi:hypothetical protein